MKAAHLIFCVFLLTMISSGAFGQKVNTDWDHSTDFTRYRTYAWLESKNPAGNQLWNQRIVQDIDSQLALKGFRKVDVGQQPDVYVTYNAGVKQNTSVVGYDYGFGPGWRWGGMGGMVQYNQVVENVGTLVVDIVDAQKKQLVWRGVASETLSDKSESNIGKLEKTVKKLFDKYPPSK